MSGEEFEFGVWAMDMPVEQMVDLIETFPPVDEPNVAWSSPPVPLGGFADYLPPNVDVDAARDPITRIDVYVRHAARTGLQVEPEVATAAPSYDPGVKAPGFDPGGGIVETIVDFSQEAYDVSFEAFQDAFFGGFVGGTGDVIEEIIEIPGEAMDKIDEVVDKTVEAVTTVASKAKEVVPGLLGAAMPITLIVVMMLMSDRRR